MKTPIAALAAVLAVLLIAGCDTGSTGKVNPFLGGTSGVTLEFMPDAPPSEVFDGGDFPFSVVVTLKNGGEWEVPIGKAKLTINGINPVEFGVTDDDMAIIITEPIEESAKDAEGNVIPATLMPIEFAEMVYGGELVGNRLFPLRANLCYEYGTRATSSLCVRANLRDTSSESPVCNVNEDKTVYSSGAPIAVTAFQEAVAGTDKVRFTITITHKGKGQIYKLGSGCNGALFSNRNRIHIAVDSGLAGLKCTGLSDGTDTEGYVTLSSDAKTEDRVITCTQPIEAQTDFDQPVNIELTYDYQDHVSTTLLVKHVGE